MKSNELRIGNLILFDGYPIKVRNFDEEWVYVYAKGGGYRDVYQYPMESVDVLPLTEEWLLKFGFDKSQEHDYFYIDDFTLDNKFILCDIDITVKVKTVHQLQNLYFALTGEELTINE